MSTTTYQFKVPSIVCTGCADTIAEVIKTADSAAQVDVDVDSKMVTVGTEMSAASVRQAITSVGHTVEQDAEA